MSEVPYLLVGALLVGAVTAGSLYMHVRNTDCICTPFIFARPSLEACT